MRIIRQFEAVLAKTEAAFITILLSAMILFSFGQVILRNVFSNGILWADLFLRQMVMWVGFLGASLAAREGRHICIDFLPHFFSDHWKKRARLLVNLCACVISAALARSAWRFVQFEKEGGTILFLDLPVWLFQTILPYSFAIIALRFLLNFLDDLSSRPRLD